MVKLQNTIDRTMFYGARPIIFEKAKYLRLHMTNPEKKLWEHLKKNQILGLRFRSQHPISFYIADFYCHKIKLVIEVDGNSHLSEEAKEYDKGRKAEFEKYGITEIRFKNEIIISNINKTIKEITYICKDLINKL
jgi:very-short-patch-repair endonuclease